MNYHIEDISFKPVTDYRDPVFADSNEVYEFGRLSHYLLHGFVRALVAQGHTKKEAVKLLQSKWLRKSLDSQEEEMTLMCNAVAKNFLRMLED